MASPEAPSRASATDLRPPGLRPPDTMAPDQIAQPKHQRVCLLLSQGHAAWAQFLREIAMGQLLGRAVLSPGWVREEEREVTGARSQPDDEPIQGRETATGTLSRKLWLYEKWK